MTQAVTHHPEHETSPWPLLTGVGVLLSVLALLAYFPWRMPLLGVVLGGAMLALFAVGLSGWAREFFTRGTEAGVGPVAVAAFIVSEVMIFGTMFAAFWLGRIDHAEQWASFIPANLDLWLPLALAGLPPASHPALALAGPPLGPRPPTPPRRCGMPPPRRSCPATRAAISASRFRMSK